MSTHFYRLKFFRLKNFPPDFQKGSQNIGFLLNLTACLLLVSIFVHGSIPDFPCDFVLLSEPSLLPLRPGKRSERLEKKISRPDFSTPSSPHNNLPIISATESITLNKSAAPKTLTK